MERDDLIEQPDTPRCAWCNTPLIGVRRGGMYCSRAHKNSARRARKRSREQVATLRSRYPLADDASLSEKYERAREHRASLDPGDLRAYSDFGDMPGDGEDDETGIYATNRDDESDQRWNDEYTLQAQIEQISDGYRRRAEPYLQQLRRNPGVRPAQLAKLEIEWQQRIDGILAAHERSKAYERAARAEPGRVARAQERQDGLQAMASFAQDLGRGGRYQARPESSSRVTTDVFAFPEQAQVFGSDREIYRRSGIARELGLRVYSTDGWL